MGTRFGEALLKPMSSGDISQQALALAGIEELARALNLPQYKEASSEELALAARITEGIAPPPKEYRDPAILKSMVDQVARLLVHHRADIRESSIRVLGLMQAHTYLDQNLYSISPLKWHCAHYLRCGLTTIVRSHA